MVIRPIGTLAFALLLTHGLRAHAQASDPTAVPDAAAEAERARALFVTGVEQAQAEHWKAAEEDFRASYALVPRPNTAYNLALTLFRQGRYQESAELCDALLSSPKSADDTAYRQRAELLRTRVRQDSALVDVIVAPEQAAWSIDGTDVPTRGPRRQAILAPGDHAFDFSAEGYERRRLALTLSKGDRHTLTVELPPATPVATSTALERTTPAAAHTESAPVPPTASSRTPQWLLLAGGGALLAAGTVTGIMALNADAEFEEQCPELHDCDQALSSLQTRTAALSTATDALLITGGLSAAGALVWLLLAQDGRAKDGGTALRPTPSGAGFGLLGRF